MNTSFKFYECFALVKLTGRKASDILQLLEILQRISTESIFHHMHQYFLRPHATASEFPNDFAVWAAESLEEHSLAEGLANVNPFEFSDIEGIRSELIRIITDYLKNFPQPRPVLPGREFLFNEGVTIVLPTGIEASTVEEFAKALREVDFSSVYFHFYEARLRLGKQRDDFSEFLGSCLSCSGVALDVKALDPYMYSTEILRNKLIKIVEESII
ncbi:MAG: DUF5752 family protein [Thermodesulfobacteriota bacterium]|nr:MAG: DUF5752 family protein [Thermodesulfobacteriota bacterium]